jgi:hypothetical protein
MAAKRCGFCGRKVDANGHCQNQNCVDYKRTQIIEKEEKNEPKK